MARPPPSHAPRDELKARARRPGTRSLSAASTAVAVAHSRAGSVSLTYLRYTDAITRDVRDSGHAMLLSGGIVACDRLPQTSRNVNELVVSLRRRPGQDAIP
ncbi:hypothetical protein PsYK624_170500 [Phanerochaete sordida]|uniref:Uncharacterized protein n=1 Tax=Phanerochaete sordida TaxID=48140 RepID=A0A9P3GT45_9APHY|nr:hypothetical protein PsYK624_170500 [Phanerochaete sordida]